MYHVQYQIWTSISGMLSKTVHGEDNIFPVGLPFSPRSRFATPLSSTRRDAKHAPMHVRGDADKTTRRPDTDGQPKCSNCERGENGRWKLIKKAAHVSVGSENRMDGWMDGWGELTGEVQ